MEPKEIARRMVLTEMGIDPETHSDAPRFKIYFKDGKVREYQALAKGKGNFYYAALGELGKYPRVKPKYPWKERGYHSPGNKYSFAHYPKVVTVSIKNIVKIEDLKSGQNISLPSQEVIAMADAEAATKKAIGKDDFESQKAFKKAERYGPRSMAPEGDVTM